MPTLSPASSAAWTPIGVEKVGSGYQVVWKNGSADQYIVWNVDSNGNYTGNATGVVSGSEYAFQSLETAFQQDLNADGTTGLKTTPIETSGATRLDQVANEFYLHDGAGNGPSLKYAGADVVAGQFGAWTPIGAEKVGSGYQVVWKNGSADQYIVWNVDSNGNCIDYATGVAPGAAVDPSPGAAFRHGSANGTIRGQRRAVLVDLGGRRRTRRRASPGRCRSLSR